MATIKTAAKAKTILETNTEDIFKVNRDETQVLLGDETIVWDAPALLLEILQQIEDADGLENKVRLSKELLAEVIQKVESSKKKRLTDEMRPSMGGTLLGGTTEEIDSDSEDEVKDTELIDEAHEAASLTVKDILRSKSYLAKTVAYIEPLTLTSTSHPEVSLFRWFTDLRTTVPISTKMCLGFLKMLGPKKTNGCRGKQSSSGTGVTRGAGIDRISTNSVC
jgi:hypothetical protein